MNSRTRFAHSLVLALAASCSLAAQRLICTNTQLNFFEVDPSTAAQTLLGPVNSAAGIVGALAYDPAGRLFLSSMTGNGLFLVDTSNWNAKLIGSYGPNFAFMHGLEWHAPTNTLYGHSYGLGQLPGTLYAVDSATASLTFIGDTGLSGFHSLSHDPGLGAMLVAETDTDSLYSVDLATAAVTLIGPITGATNSTALAYDSDTQTTYLLEGGGLHSLDTNTGAPTLVGNLPIISANLGLVYVPGTGRMTRATHGCGTPTIFASGSPNIGRSVDFEVENTSGVAFVGFGIASINAAFCGCTIGHDWSVAVPGATAVLPIPATPTIIGFDVFVQGLDFLGTSGCQAPQLALTDTVTVSVGT